MKRVLRSSSALWLVLAAGEEQMSEKVTGYIDHVIFRNDENGYTVMVLKTADSEEELTCVGTFPDVTQGVTIEAEGQFSQHHIYGRQQGSGETVCTVIF